MSSENEELNDKINNLSTSLDNATALEKIYRKAMNEANDRVATEE